jgi:hypothetical protein
MSKAWSHLGGTSLDLGREERFTRLLRSPSPQSLAQRVNSPRRPLAARSGVSAGATWASKVVWKQESRVEKV